MAITSEHTRPEDLVNEGQQHPIYRGIESTLEHFIKQQLLDPKYKGLKPQVRRSKIQSLGQFQSPFALTHASDPLAFAQSIVDGLNRDKRFRSIAQSATVSPPGFINIVLQDSFTWNLIPHIYNDERHGCPLHEQKKVFIDFGGVNIAKPLHIGHIRSLFIGDCLQRLYRFLGYDTVSDIHLGDWGVQVGMIIGAFEEMAPDSIFFRPAAQYPGPSESPFSIEQLCALYPAAAIACKADIQKMQRAKALTALVQQKQPGIYDLWKCIVHTSLTYIRAEVAKMGIGFDLWLGESDAQDTLMQLLHEGVAKGLIYHDQGAMVVDVGQIVPLLKEDGAALYSMTDVATAKDRIALGADKIIYVIDKRQKLHIEQVFKICAKMNIAPEDKFLYIGFGTVNGVDGRPYKTRSGDATSLEDVQRDARSYVFLRENADFSPEEQEKIKDEISLATMKFATLAVKNSSDYIFNMQSFLKYEGKTGPYILYAAVRIKSILQKNNLSDDTSWTYHGFNEIERELCLQLLRS